MPDLYDELGLNSQQSTGADLASQLPQARDLHSELFGSVKEEPTAPVGDLSTTGSIGRGVDILKANLQSAIGEFDSAKNTLAESEKASIPSFRQVGDVGTAVQFAAERTLESLPSTGLGLLGATIGFLSPIPGGALIGGAIGSGVPLLGESRREIKNEGGEGSVLQALPPAALNTALEVLRVGQVAKSLGVGKVLRETTEEVISEVPEITTLAQKIGKGGKDVAVQGASEGLVEASQEFNNMIAGKFFANKEVLALPEQDQERLLEAFFGGVGGGVGTSVVAQGTGAVASPVVDTIKTSLQKRKNKKLMGTLGGIVQDRIRQKKISIDEGNDILAAAAERFDSTSPFEVFKGLTGVSFTEHGTLPVGASGLGPGASIFGHHKSAADERFNRAFDELIIDLGRDDSGEILMGTSKDVQHDPKRVSRIRIEEELIDLPDDGERQINVRDVQEDVAAMLDEMMNILGVTDMPVVLGDMSSTSELFQEGYTSNALGHFYRSENKGTVIGVDYAAAFGKHDTRAAAMAEIFSIATHELGHAVINHQWNGLDTTTKNGLLQGYREWLAETEFLSEEDWMKKYHPAGILNRISGRSFSRTQTMYEKLEESSLDNRAYYTSFDEYAAQMIARALEKRLPKSMSADEKSYWNQIVEMFEKIYERFKSRLPATETFESFIEGMTLRKQVKEMEEYIQELENPTGERKDIIESVHKDLMTERESGLLTKEDYDSLTPNAMADLLSALGLEDAAVDLRRHQDVNLGFMKIAALLTPLQIAELSKQSGRSNPDRYMQLVREYSNTKMKQIEMADEIAQKWRALGTDQSRQLGNFIYDMSTKSDEESRRLTPEELTVLRARHGLTEETFSLWQEIDQSFQSVLGNIERGLVLDASKSFIRDTSQAKAFRDQYIAAGSRQRKLQLIVEFTGQELIPLEGDQLTNPLFVELSKIEDSMKELRDRNYFPRSRLGQYIITIKSTQEGQEWEGHTSSTKGETVGFYAFDSKRERNAMAKALMQDTEAAGLSQTSSIMDSEVFAMMGMPDVLIQSIMSDGKVDLNEQQKEALKNVSLNLSPGKRFLRHLKKRKGIAGFNEDALRVYSTYMMTAANHLARVEHSKALAEELQSFSDDIKALEQQNLGGNISDLVRLKNYFQRHFDYLMKPDNDWASLRSAGFLWYLGFNVKSALVNLTQIPMVTYPVLAGRYGDRKASGAIAKAYRDIPKLIKDNEALAEDEMAMMQELRESGILDESMVMELAGMGEADILKRSIPGWKLDNVLNKLSYYGGGMFRMAEKFNRNVTALSAYRLARDNGHANPVMYAREAIEKSQFEYSKWNRAEFMRGKKSVIFLFWQYMQHASFLFFGGEGRKTAMRMWIFALFIAGVEGLPFAKTIMQFLNFAGTEMKELFGSSDPRVALQEDLRSLLLEITDQPDHILRGMSSFWGLGPLHLASLLGAPIPQVDISGSLSFGSPVQFLDEALVGTGNPDEEIGKMAKAIGGPVGSMIFTAYESMRSTDPDTWKRMERTMPVAIKNALQGARWINDGKETFRGGGEFLNMDKPEQRVSAFMKFLGFQPTRLTQKYNQVTAQQEASVYWTLRKQLLMEDYAFAKHTGDREQMKDTMEGIRSHNKAMRKTKGLQGLTISGKDMRNSLRSRERSRVMRERGLPGSEKQVPLFKEIAKRFPIDER